MKRIEKMTKVFICFSFLFFYACSGNRTLDRMGRKLYTFDLGKDQMFFLDSMTTQETSYVQLIDDDRFAIYNEPENAICIFSIDEGKEIGKKRLYKEGPNAVLGIQGFYYQSKDSVWLYKSWEQELVLVNDSCEIIKKKKLADKLPPLDKLVPYTVSPYPFGDLPISKCGNMLILQGMNGPGVEDGLQPATTILYNLKSDKVRVSNPYPAIYGDMDKINEHWGTFSYRAVPYTLNKKDEMVVSFPASDSVRVYNVHNDSYASFFAGYSLETNIKPLSSGCSQADIHRQYLEQYQYAGILYDKYHDLYYRLVMLPTFDYDLRISNTQYKELAIIILNSSFKKVGEYKLGRAEYKYRNIFVAKDGLYINVPSDDDDYLKFITLKVRKNEE